MSLCDIAAHMPVLTEYARNASFVLELGIGQGDGSTAALVQGLMESKAVNPLMISVDREAEGFVRPAAPFWCFVQGDTTDKETMIDVGELSWGRSADLIFIDTEHTPEQIWRELSLWNWLASRSTIWLFHDTWMMGEYNPMTDAIKEYAARNGWRYDDLSKESHGLGRMMR